MSLNSTVLSEGDFSSFYHAHSCVVLRYPAVFITCSAFPYTTDTDTSFSFSAWSPPLNITPWVISLHCHSTLSPLLTFTHCSHPIKSDLPSGLLFQAVKSAKPETKQQNAALPSPREVMTSMFTLLHKLFGLLEEAPKKHVIF